MRSIRKNLINLLLKGFGGNSVLTVQKDIYLNVRMHYNCLLDDANMSFCHDKITQSGKGVKALPGIMNDLLQ